MAHERYVSVCQLFLQSISNLGVYHLVVRVKVIIKEGGSRSEWPRIEEGFDGPDWAQEVVGQGGQLDPMV